MPGDSHFIDWSLLVKQVVRASGRRLQPQNPAVASARQSMKSGNDAPRRSMVPRSTVPTSATTRSVSRWRHVPCARRSRVRERLNAGGGSTTLKIAVLPPIPTTSATIAARANPGDRRRLPTACRTSRGSCRRASRGSWRSRDPHGPCRKPVGHLRKSGTLRTIAEVEAFVHGGRPVRTRTRGAAIDGGAYRAAAAHSRASRSATVAGAPVSTIRATRIFTYSGSAQRGYDSGAMDGARPRQSTAS